MKLVHVWAPLVCVAVLVLVAVAAAFSISVGHPSVILFVILGVDALAVLVLGGRAVVSAMRRGRGR